MTEEELLPTFEPLPKQELDQKNLDSSNSETSSLVTSVSHLRIKLQIGFAFLTFVLLGANDAAIGVLLPHWGNYYHVDKTILSLVFFAGSVGYLVAALNSNFLFRKLGNVKFLSLGKLAFLSGVIIFCFQPPIYLILTVPFLLGFGAAILEAALNAHLAKLPNKTALLNYLHSFYGVGALLSPFLASQILMTFSVTSAFGLLLTGFCLGPILPTALAFLANVIPPHLLTGAISFIASLGSLGKAFFPWIAGNIAENLGLEMFLPYIISIIGVMIMFWIVILDRANQGETAI